MLDMHQISCFAAAYQFRSISKAAESMFVSQQAVSHNIREMEKRLGGALFERCASGVIPTKLGEAIYEDALELLHGCAALEEKAAAIARGGTALTLSYADGIFSVEDAPDMDSLAAFVQGELQAPLHLRERTTSECMTMLKNRETDMMIAFNPTPERSLCIEVLREYPLYVAMAPDHPLAHRDVVTKEEMACYPLIRDQRDNALNAMMRAYAITKEIELMLYAPSAQHASFARIMRRDKSLLMFTMPFLRTYAGEDARIIPFAGSDTPLRLCAVYAGEHPRSAKLGKIAAWLKAHYRQTA